MIQYIYSYLACMFNNVYIYVRHKLNIVLIMIGVFLLGIAIGIIVAIRLFIVRECIILTVVNGDYSAFAYFFRLMLILALSYFLLVLTSTLKYQTVFQAILIFIWGIKFGGVLFIHSRSFWGILSLLIFYIPYFVLSVLSFLIIIAYIQTLKPETKPRWFTLDKCTMMTIYRVTGISFVVLTVIFAILFIIAPMFIHAFIVII